jgi:hypothetical protein
MATARRRPLKVFQAQFGFYDTIVAAPSQAAALRAWGVHQNLFADGQARVCEDAQALEAARAQPETPLRRPVGSQDPFVLQPAGLPTVPDGPRTSRTPAQARPTPKKPPADRSSLDEAEGVLRKLNDHRKREEAKLNRRRRELEADAAAAQDVYAAARKAADATVAAARKAFREAGGED